ncbi:hypothetical protein Tco_0883656 [Tanacetum coccineum]
MINTVYPLPLDTAYRSSGTETEILVFLFDFRAKFFSISRANPTDFLSLVSGGNLVLMQILDSKGAIPSKTAADAKVAIQEMAEYSQKWHNGTSRFGGVTLGIPTRRILDSRGAIPSKAAADVKTVI